MKDKSFEFLHYEPKCPKCGHKLIKIVYGMPDSKLMEKAKRREVILGGCEITGEMPEFHCNQCNIDYFNNLKSIR